MAFTADHREPMKLSKEQLSREPVRIVAPPFAKHTSPTTIATIQLSNLDMLFDYYNSVVLFYDVHHPHSSLLQDQTPPQPQCTPSEPVARLHRAVEELLLHYPCAGGLLVLNDTSGRLEVQYLKYVGCDAADSEQPLISNNASNHAGSPSFGVPFHVAHANVSLAELGDVSNPHPSLDLLFPSKPVEGDDSDERRLQRHVLAFQVTTFKCGGFTLASTCSNVYADGYTGARLLQNLCSLARGAGLASRPPDISQTRTLVLGAREPPTPTVHHPFIQARKPKEKPPLKHLHYGAAIRFAFDENVLERLRAHAAKDGNCMIYSRNQALMALLSTAFGRVSVKVHALPKTHVMNLRFPINLRTRGIPNLTIGYMGNAICQCAVSATLQELCESPLGKVADKFRSTMGSLDFHECVQSVVDYVELQLRDGLIPYTVGLSMTSLVGLPFYDTDCGWGNPMYVSRPSQQLSDRCIILDHPAARAWNVLVVFSSSEEHSCFKESIAEYIDSS
ncbi:hypothetical protein GOP47_0027676 [Adiantum capillus-veneris]|nr:hypothetical protein GOP47_0027676 [Adiantum capillus-veneris]